jgi:hypothetical protein
MIAANELRIGNWVDQLGKYYQVVSVAAEDGDEYVKCNDGDLVFSKSLTPIPLTPEILESVGFKLETKVWWKFPDEDISGWVLLDNSPVDESFSLCYDQLVLGIPLTKYLHQLQNLFYSLTHTEIIFNNHE